MLQREQRKAGFIKGKGEEEAWKKWWGELDARLIQMETVSERVMKVEWCELSIPL